MTLNRFFVLVLLVLLSLVGCSGGGGGSGSSSGQSITNPTGSNVLLITVNGSLCSSATSYLNKPCVRVTICEPGNMGNCQTISDILLDTGSSGLRIFKQVLSVPLQQVSVDSESLAECVQYGDNSSTWGPVQIASVRLGDQPAVQLPMQVIDADFGSRPSTCSNAVRSPNDESAKFNGILGIDNFTHDLCSTCGNPTYYLCSGSTCSQTSAPLDKQVQNPVALLPSHNNGFSITFPSIPAKGSASVNGYLVMGIGTSTNNTPSAVTTYPVDKYGEFITVFNAATYSAIADTGSNGLFFGSPPADRLPDCEHPNDAWFCPSSTQTLSATNQGTGGSPSLPVSFEIGNLVDLASTGKSVFRNIGGDVGLYLFDWGLPFFLGRTVYFGIDGTSSSLGTGPYIAY